MASDDLTEQVSGLPSPNAVKEQGEVGDSAMSAWNYDPA